MLNRLKGKYSLLVCWVFLGLVTLVTLAGGKWKKQTVIKSDAAGYYVYLSSTFIYNDLFQCNFYPVIDSLYDPGNGVVYYGIQLNHETNRFYFKYNYGVAAFELPLFVTAHVFAKATGLFNADGYSPPYQLSVALSTVLFSFFSLLLLRRFLLSYFNETVTAITLVILGFGTNFLAQVITQPGLSHVYLFFLFTLILYSTQKLYETAKWKYILLLAAALGLVLVTRPSDLFICLFPLLWKVGDKNFRANFFFALSSNLPKVAGSFLLFLVLVFIQLLYWKTATGHWYFYTYRREYFDFGNWQIINGLFSYRKGWFVYTPLALLGFLGCVFLWRKETLRFYLLPFVLYFSITLYVVFCWWQWYYGGSFGCRVLVESLALMALPLAALIDWLMTAKKTIRYSATIIIALLVTLNVFQTGQYAMGIIHWQKMNKEYYWRVFGKLKVTEKDKELLNQTEDITTDASPYR